MGHTSIENGGGGWKYFFKKFVSKDGNSYNGGVGSRTHLLSTSGGNGNYGLEEFQQNQRIRKRSYSTGDSADTEHNFNNSNNSSYNYNNDRDTKIIYVNEDDNSQTPTPTSSQMSPLLRNYGSMSNLMHISKSEFMRIKRDRAVTKTGICNFVPKNIESRKVRYMYDIFTTVLEFSWPFLIGVFCLSYVISWVFFAIWWFLIPYIHGDMENADNPLWKPCITGINNFVNALLFSIETQHTTGYGYYHITDQCPSAIFLLCCQSIFGVMIEGVLVGLVFVKMGRAKKRNATLLFSRKAVISTRDGQLFFMFRIADSRRSCSLIGAKVRAQIVKRRVTIEGEIIPYYQKEIEVGGDGERNNEILLYWPTTVVHHINKSSPLYTLSASDFGHHSNFEIIICLEGIVESTGLTTQARTSYLPSEILWGHRFQCLSSTKTARGEREIDFVRFHGTHPVKTPDQSASDCERLTSLLSKIKEKRNEPLNT